MSPDAVGAWIAAVLLGLLFLIVLLVVTVLTTRRSSALDRRIALLEEAVARLERRVRAGESRATEASPAPAPQPVPARPEPAAATPPVVPVPPHPARPAPTPVDPLSLQWRAGPLPPGTAPPAPPSPRPTLSGTRTTPPIEWERWVGIRGAAVLGGVVLALAGLLLFQYSIQRGLITPPMRVGIGIVVGLACLVVSEWLKARGYRYTPEATAGAGIVILYAAFWAAYTLYALIGLGLAFGLMALVTVVCGLLSLRHASQIIAVLGLVGGFATPLVLRSDVDRPFGLFGYALLLDLGLIAIGRSKRWPALAVLSVAGTLVLQTVWIGTRMKPDQLGLALGILGLFAVLFALGGESRKDEDDPSAAKTWLAAQGLGLVLPFTFAVWFAFRSDLGPHLYPLGLLMGLLVGAAGWLGLRRGAPMPDALAACGTVAVTGVWMLQRPLTAPLAWEAAAVAAALTALFLVFAELDPHDARLEGPATGVILAAGGFFLVSVVSSGARGTAGLWPSLSLWVALSAVFLRLGVLPERAPFALAGGIGTGLGLAMFHLAHGHDASFPGWTIFLLAAVGVSAAACAIALAARATAAWRPFAARGAGVLPAIVLFSLAVARGLEDLDPVTALGGALALGALVAAPSALLSEGAWLALGGGLTVLVQTVWTAERLHLLRGLSPAMDASMGLVRNAALGAPEILAAQADLARRAFAPALLSALVFTAWPFLARRRLLGDRTAWLASALALPIWLPALRRLFHAAFGGGAIGALPLGLAAVAAGAAALSWRIRAQTFPERRGAIVAFGASAFVLVALAVPLQYRQERLTIGWAVCGLAAIALWRRLDHPGLKWGGLTLFTLVAMRLLLNAEVLSYHPRSDVRILNWLATTYLVPAGAMLLGAGLLRGREAARAAPWESELYRGGRDVGAAGTALAAIFVVFAWLNLAVLDWFATGPELRLHLAHVPACDLTLSIVWALFALVLLGLGMAGGSALLRWLSLSFLVLTIGKVFLYDLGQLRDLYRVASLVGLALSLLLVSLLYQRFVFRRAR